MGESSSSSNNEMPLANETQGCRTSNLPTDGCGANRISIDRMESRSNARSFEESIENSKSHWSEVRNFDCIDEVAEVSNVEVFETLQRHPTYGGFFWKFGEGEEYVGALAIGQKFAEGGQAELYDVQIEWSLSEMREQDLKDGFEWVLKVFKKGTFLQHLQAQWPEGILQFHVDKRYRYDHGLPQLLRFHSDIIGATLLKDGRFAFLMVKEGVDLRSWIDHRRSGLDIMGPLSRRDTMWVMYNVAFGMNQLHEHGIVHRDLKASNVLISRDGACYVADYECSIGVVGTGFFRAPEVLQACKDRIVSSKVEIFTKAVDVYSYGMVCYEILTGKLPFEGYPLNDYDLVISGGRLEVPQYIDGWIGNLLNSCWHSNPASRPSFKNILKILVTNSSICLAHSLVFLPDLDDSSMIVQK